MIPNKWPFFLDSSLGIPYIVLWFNVFNKELLALRNNFRVTKKFLIAKFDCTTFLKKTLVEKLKLLLPFLFRCCIFFSVWTFQGCYRKSLTTWQHTYPGQYVPSRQEPCLPSPLQIFTPHCQSSNNYWSAIYNFGT